MIKKNNPAIDVHALMKEVEALADGKKKLPDNFSSGKQSGAVSGLSGSNAFKMRQLDTMIEILEERCMPRSRFPASLNRFPFNKSKKLQSLFLRFYEMLFREERETNTLLLESVRALQECIRTIQDETTEQAQRVAEQQKRNEEECINLRREIMLQRRLIRQSENVPERIQQSDEATVIQKENSSPLSQTEMNAFYLTLEDTFRGTPEEIAERAKEHLPFLDACGAGKEATPVLDLGCGRGEWLQLLKKEGKTAFGVELNPFMAEEAEKRGVQVHRQDAIAYLETLEENSLGAITAFHLIEHLPFEKWFQLFDESLRVLQKGGLFLLETPNPETLTVGASSFYLDPTHQRPVPPSLLHLFAENRGFSSVSVLPLHPVPSQHALQEETAITERLNGILFGEQDYALLAYKS